MANIADYIKWRGDIDFSMDPFNEVDNLIFAELAYVDFSEIVPGPKVQEWVSLSQVHQAFFEKYDRDEIMSRVSSTKVAPFLMDDMVTSRRFCDVKLSGYVNQIDTATQSQFSVVTFLLPDGTLYVAYRGTDNTIVGWKEDFNMSFLYQTPGQISAAKYIDDNFKYTLRPIRVGGHSKGGNFAVYGATFCDRRIQDKIIQVYSNDGPGFLDQVTTSQEYARIISRVTSIIPEQSIVGMLLENHLHHIIVQSSQTGAYQHDAMSWQVRGKQFVYAPALSENSIYLDRTLKNWVLEQDLQRRKEFVDILFEIIASTGASTMDEFTSSGWKALLDMSKTMTGMPLEKQSAFREVVKALVISSGDTLVQSMRDKLSVIEKVPFIDRLSFLDKGKNNN